MSEGHLYETIIADKLEHIAVPDMADAIWVRIKNQLDIDMPPGDDPSPTPGSNPPPSKPSRYISPVIVTAVILCLFYFSNKNKQQPHIPPVATPSNSIQISIPQPDHPSSPRAKPQPQRKPVVSQQDSLPPGSLIPSQDNTTSVLPVMPHADSIITLPPAEKSTLINAPFLIPASDSVPVKKPKGVRGISDKDYKIVPRQ